MPFTLAVELANVTCAIVSFPRLFNKDLHRTPILISDTCQAVSRGVVCPTREWIYILALERHTIMIRIRNSVEVTFKSGRHFYRIIIIYVSGKSQRHSLKM